MAEHYRGLVGAFLFAGRRSRSWLFRSYVLFSAFVGAYTAILFTLGLVSWIGRPGAFGERAFLAVIAIFLLLPLFAPVLLVARRNRRSETRPGADRLLGLAGYGFVVSVVLALLISDPTEHEVAGIAGIVLGWIDRLPAEASLVPPVVAIGLLVLAGLVSRPTDSS